MNRYAPGALLGLGADQGTDGPETFFYTKDIVLTASQQSNESIDIDPDADYEADALVYSSTGTFALKITDSRQYQHSSGRIASQNLSNDPTNPFPFQVPLPFPRHGKILLDIVDTSGAGNTIQLVFYGRKV